MKKQPMFEDYFVYVGLQNGGKTTELADRWLLENYLLEEGQDINNLKFKDIAGVLGKFKSDLTAVKFFDGINLDGHILEFVDGPSALYFEMQRKCSQNIADGLRFGILNSYRADGEHLSKVATNLSFQTAEILSKDIMSFFN